MLADDVAQMAAGTRALPSYDRHMGFRLASWSPEGAVLEADADPATGANPTGVLHGGVLCGLADSAMGLTVSGLMGAGETCTNTDLQVRFLRAVHGRTLLRAQARIVRRGRRVAALECDVTDSQGRLVARASSTFLVLQDGTI